VIIVSDGPGSRSDFVTTFSPTGNAPTSFVSNFITPGADSFVAYGVSLLPSLNIPSGDTAQIAGTLSLVADGDVTLQFSVLPMGLQLPDLGAMSTVPEPSSVVMLGIGILGIYAFVWRRKASTPVAAKQRHG
jgi:hypothetical protein